MSDGPSDDWLSRFFRRHGLTENQQALVVVWGIGFIVQFVRELAELVRLNTPYTFEPVHIIGIPVTILAAAGVAALWPAIALGWILREAGILERHGRW